MKRLIPGSVILMLAASGALAQAVDQISPPSRASEAVEQISADNFAPPPQLTAEAQGQAQEPQLTSEGRSVRTPLQLYQGGRTALPSQALSRPSEGRTAAVAPVGGTDRCDEVATNAADRAACAHVIETRSAEFERPDPVTLSPEQRLLVEQRLREVPASRRLASTGLDPNSLEEQAVASLTLRPTPPDERDKPEDERSASEAAAAALVNAIVNGPGQPAPPGP